MWPHSVLGALALLGRVSAGSGDGPPLNITALSSRNLILGARVLAAVVRPRRRHVGGQLRRRQHHGGHMVAHRAAHHGWRGLGAARPVSPGARSAEADRSPVDN